MVAEKSINIETISKRLVYENRWMRVREDTIRRDSLLDGTGFELLVPWEPLPGTQRAMTAGLQRKVDRYALKRIAEPMEIAQAIVFLTGTALSFVTGALAVDGGRTFH